MYKHRNTHTDKSTIKGGSTFNCQNAQTPQGYCMVWGLIHVKLGQNPGDHLVLTDSLL